MPRRKAPRVDRHSLADRYVTRIENSAVYEYSSLEPLKLDDGREYGFSGFVVARQGVVRLHYARRMSWSQEHRTYDLYPEQHGHITMILRGRSYTRNETRPGSRALTMRGAVIVAKRWARELEADANLWLNDLIHPVRPRSR